MCADWNRFGTRIVQRSMRRRSPRMYRVTLAITWGIVILLLSCGDSHSAGSRSSAEMAPSTTAVIVPLWTSLPEAPETIASTTSVVSPTTIVDADDNVTVSTTTTLAIGPPDPTGDTLPGQPLYLVITSDQILGPANYDPHLQSAVFHATVNAIVRFVMTPSADWRTEAGLNIEVPHSDDASVLTPITDRGICPTDSVCATFVASAPGIAHVVAGGISGCGTSGCVAALTYEAAIVVSN